MECVCAPPGASSPPPCFFSPEPRENAGARLDFIIKAQLYLFKIINSTAFDAEKLISKILLYTNYILIILNNFNVIKSFLNLWCKTCELLFCNEMSVR